MLLGGFVDTAGLPPTVDGLALLAAAGAGAVLEPPGAVGATVATTVDPDVSAGLVAALTVGAGTVPESPCVGFGAVAAAHADIVITAGNASSHVRRAIAVGLDTTSA